MDKIYADSNMENDNTEHIRGKRLSSILKAPRNPLDDLGSGNELTQDITIEKRRKNSRRVSFANTIKVFQRDLKNNTSEGEHEGMNTLLHAPIQSLVQQTECHDVDNAIPRTDRPDTTLIFSEENEMDMTASHTAVITRNLKNNQTDKTEKIDIVSFLAELNSGNAETSEEFHFSFDPTNCLCPSFEPKVDVTTAEKMNSNEFFMNLKSNEEAFHPIEGPEKENVFFVPSQVPEDRVRSSMDYMYSHEQLATCNVTKIFREQDDGMEMTKCQASDIQNMRSGSVSSETVFRDDKTVVFSKCDDMEITGNYTDVIFSENTEGMNNLYCQNSDRQEKTHPMKVVNNALPTPEDPEKTVLLIKKSLSEADFKNPQSGGGLHLRGVEETLLANNSKQHTGNSQLHSFLEKSVVFPSGENMDLTENCAVVAPDQNICTILPGRKTAPGHIDEDKNKTSLKKEVMMAYTISAVPAEKTVVFRHSQDDMEITSSHTVAVSNSAGGSENQE
ncbi:KNL1 protein, partial [Penelope pileata]|nr:KNL1 protein [Penelope pileata]